MYNRDKQPRRSRKAGSRDKTDAGLGEQEAGQWYTYRGGVTVYKQGEKETRGKESSYTQHGGGKQGRADA